MGKPTGTEEPDAFDPQVDLTKPEQGVLDIAQVLTQTSDAIDQLEIIDGATVDKIESLSSHFEQVLAKQPTLVSSLAYKLDKKLRRDPLVVEVAQCDMREMHFFEDEELGEVYRKARMLGELFIDIEDYKLAEVYLFLALKIDHVRQGINAADDKFDTDFLINLAEAVYKCVDNTNFRLRKEKDTYPERLIGVSELTEALYKKYILFLGPFWKQPTEEKDNSIDLTPDERLFAASDLLNLVLARDERNVDAHEILSEINQEHAGQYISMAERDYHRIPRQFTDADIRYVEYCFEEARTHALKAAVYAEDDEMELRDDRIYFATSREFAAFLMKAGRTQRAINIFNDLINRGIDTALTKAKIVEAMLDSITYWNGVKGKSPENLQTYVKLRNTAIKYLEEIVQYVRYEAAEDADEDELKLLISAYQYLGKLALNDGSVEEVEMYIAKIREVNHSESEEWALDLEEVLKEKLESGEVVKKN